MPRQADGVAVAGLLSHWQQALVHLGFLDPKAPKKLIPRLQHLVNRAELTQEEVHILRGVAKAMLEATPAHAPAVTVSAAKAPKAAAQAASPHGPGESVPSL